MTNTDALSTLKTRKINRRGNSTLEKVCADIVKYKVKLI